VLRRIFGPKREGVTREWRRLHNEELHALYSDPITGMDRPLGLREVGAPRIFRQSAHESGKVVSPTHRPSLPQERFLVLISVRS
jgi:hypothetical protein